MSAANQQFDTVSRTMDVKKAATKYASKAARELVEASYNYQAHTRGTDLVLERTMAARDMIAWYARHAGESGKPGSDLATMPGVASDSVRKALGHQDEGEEGGFYGMAAASYLKEIAGEASNLQKGIEQAQQELARSGIQQALEESMVGLRKRRKRCTSEHDGEWSMDRQWDSHPFLGTLFAKREFPFVEVIYPIGMNCSASAKTIAQFNARCLALCEVLENAGYRVAITPECWGKATLSGVVEYNGKKYGGYNVYEIGRFPTREANEYGDIKSFSVIACAEYFRRCLFAGHLASFNLVHGFPDAVVSGGLGQAVDDRPVPAVAGQLVLTKNVVDQIFNLSGTKAQEIFQDRMRHTVGLKEEYKAS